MTLEVTATVANPAPANFFIDFTFDWLDEGDISVYKNGSATAMARSTWKFITRERIEVLSGNFAADDSFKLLRESEVGSAAVTFVPGASIRAQDLNRNQQQVLNVSEELKERSVKATGGSMTGNLEMNDANIIFEGTTADAHETTLTVVEPTADRTISLPNVGGTLPVLAVASTTQITSTPEELNTLDGVESDLTAADLNKLNDVTEGTVAASKVVIVDSDRDISNFRNVSATGNITATGSVTAAGGSFSAAVAMGSNKITGLAAPTADNDAATKTYVDGVALDSSVPEGQKGPDVDAVTSARWQIISISTPQVIADDLDYATAYGDNMNHMLIGDVELDEDAEMTIGDGSVLTIFKP